MHDGPNMLGLMSQILEYPGEGLPAATRSLEALLRPSAPEASGALSEFAAFVEAGPAEKLEEIYTSTFDLNPQCYPYAGYQLFGDDPKRTDLMLRLQQRYCSSGFEAGYELPDHVPLLLRFLSQLEDEEEARELSELVLSPVLAKMSKTLGDKQNPYAHAVAAAAALVGEP